MKAGPLVFLPGHYARTMPKKKTLKEKAAQVRSKGFNDDETTIDAAPVHRSLQPGTNVGSLSIRSFMAT